jgi:hypothetical protein
MPPGAKAVPVSSSPGVSKLAVFVIVSVRRSCVSCMVGMDGLAIQKTPTHEREDQAPRMKPGAAWRSWGGMTSPFVLGQSSEVRGQRSVPDYR